MNGEKLKYLKQLQGLYDDEIFLSLNNNLQIDKNHIIDNTNSVQSELIEYHNIGCSECGSSDTMNFYTVGAGDADASLLLVGETLDQNESVYGEPLLEKASKLLDKMLQAINMSRNSDVFICDALKGDLLYFSKNKRTHQIRCERCFINQIDLIQPKLIVALGRFAAKTLLGVEKSLKEMRGEMYEYHSKSLIITYHPVALLKNSKWKVGAWKDFKWILELLKNN